jgi:hypothetical protein
MAMQTRTRPRGPLIVLALATFALAAANLSGQQVVNLPAADRSLQPQIEDVYRVGKIDGASWEIFGERPEVAFDGDGNLYVFDPTSHRVVVINPAGRFVRQIGRRGDGPGELRSPMGFVVMRDGTVIIGDMGHAAFLEFAPDGTYRRSVSFRGSDGLTVLGALYAEPSSGTLLSAGRRVAMIQAGGGARMGAMGASLPSDRAIVRFDLGAPGKAESVFTGWAPAPAQAAPARGNAPMGPGAGGPAMRAQARAFEPALLASTLPGGGLVVSDSTAYDVKVLSSEGRIERVLRRPIKPAAVTPQIERAERDRRLAEMAAGRGPQVQVAGRGPGGAPGGGAGPSQAQMQQMQRQQIDQLQFYPEVSVVESLRTGWTGKIWIGRRGTGRDALARGPLDVLTPTGDYLGSIAASRMALPDAFGPNGLAAWIERDQFDTPIMVVRRLPAELR